MKDYYRMLGVAPVDTKEKIQSVYREVSKGYRGGIKAELKSKTDDMMKQTITAYNILNDDQKRKDYDAQPQFQVRRTSAKMLAATGKKAPPKEDKKSFQWGIPIMDILMMPFKKADSPKEDQSPEEKAMMHFTLGVSMSDDKEHFEQAKGEFLKALKYVPDFRESLYNGGLMAYRIGSYDEAIELFKSVLNVESRDIHAKKMLELLDNK
jgi:DnaJ-class molecular chaperone